MTDKALLLAERLARKITAWDHVTDQRELLPFAEAFLAMREAAKKSLPFVNAIYREHGREYLENSGDAQEFIQAAIAAADKLLEGEGR